jgi:transcriptional regulator with XRE-family HTH domain
MRGVGTAASTRFPRHRMIKQRREQLGIGMADLARRISVEPSMYWDVELYDDETFVHRIESDGVALETYPYDVSRSWQNT